ncbi:C-terminal processing protease CtpA/Prc, contains a PDZ domain [Christiangramia echinicola]|uniref:C-terminal processing protease CtpA/Prc, contains a PDZ domain n=2 Tax=Christiangramia echinicola TaxID=279359 RepID=A0A1H1R6W0_9FLAO|nr:C-terminal processing protease CtpA/Prc, contains a PDZ domain [Christiangramia echinicola]
MNLNNEKEKLMKLRNILMLTSLLCLALIGCTKDTEDIETNSQNEITRPDNSVDNPELEVENFVYNGLNEIYLYKSDIPELANGYFQNTNDKSEFLAKADSPEDLFDNLTSSIDRFSFITDDYESLEDSFDGISGATGIKFGIGRIAGTNNIFGIIRYILPGTSAEDAGLVRGNIFTEINGQKLTSNNFSSLIDQSSFTINVGYVENSEIFLTENEVTLTDDNYTENPVFIAKTFDIGGRKIGYLMYNSFIANFDEELNKAFGDFKANGVTDLVLDLRYNGGGSVESAKDLSSMITGQFKGKIFIKEQWNTKYQNFYEAQNPEALNNRFDDKIRGGASINSLNLSEVYILTSNSSASASELVINGLTPYISVIQIGDRTVGKFQASVTLYDSEDYSKSGRSTNHTYAIQPLVFKSINSAGKSDYIDGLQPDITYIENLNDFGILGEQDEPLLEIAINDILGRSQTDKSQINRLEIELLGESGMNNLEYQKMYIDALPDL